MGSNSRTSYWKFPDPVQDSILNFTQNGSFRAQSAEENSAGDLKLGRLGDLNTFVDRLKNPMTSDSSSGSYKRARAHNNALHVPSCLVDGCVSDLSNCRDYHKRHKVCESHSKTPLVTIGGQERRFCQQCSRFHSLGEFDEAKRSCRRRLDGHNRRRRKDKSDSLSLNSSKFNPAHQDSKFISYGTQYFRNSALESSSWNNNNNNAIKAQNNSLYFNSQRNLKTINFSSPLPHGYREEKQFPFLQGAAADSLSLVHLSGSNKMLFYDGIDQVINSGRASSLLSSLHSETCGFNPTHDFVQPSTSQCSSSLAMVNNGCNSNVNMD